MAHMAIRLKQEGWCVLPIFCAYTDLTGSGMALIRYITGFLEEQTNRPCETAPEGGGDLPYWEKRLNEAAAL